MHGRGSGRPAKRSGGRLAVVAPAVGLLVSVGSGPAWAATAGTISLVSVSSSGQQADRYADGDDPRPAVSAHGRYVAFTSYASNLVPGDTNGTFDVFVRDQVAGTTRRVSVGAGGAQGDNASSAAAISADGRYVSFQSYAGNLVPGDTNATSDVFVRDLVAGVTRRVSVGAGGAQADSNSFYTSISANGRYVAFASFASNLVADDTNGATDVFVRDTVAGVTRRASVASGGQQADDASVSYSQPTISGDGRFVMFDSVASNLVPGDTNGIVDVFLRDTVAGVTRRVSVNSGGAQTNGLSLSPSVSAHGAFVAFVSGASNLVSGDGNDVLDVFVRDVAAGTTRRVSVGPGGADGDGQSFDTAMSADGQSVAFESFAANLVGGDTNGTADVFVTDTRSGATRRVSVGSKDGQAHHECFLPAISADGLHVAFLSAASHLVPGDTNGVTDVFVRDEVPAA